MKTLIMISMAISSVLLPSAIINRNVISIAGSTSGILGALVWQSTNKRNLVSNTVNQSLVEHTDTLEATFNELWEQENS